jgi:hypothetical protein
MKLRGTAVLLAAAACLALASQAAAEDLTVFVTVRPTSPDDVARKQEASARAASFDREKKALEDSLKKQFGKKKELWPAEKRAEFEKLAAGASRASFEATFGVADPKEIEASAAGIREKLADKKGVRAVGSAAEADLQVEVMGRYQAVFLSENTCFIGLRISPGARLDPARVAKAAIAWKTHRHGMSGAVATSWHDFTEEAPFWLVEVNHPAGGFRNLMYGKAEGHATSGLEKFAKESGAAILACRKS